MFPNVELFIYFIIKIIKQFIMIILSQYYQDKVWKIDNTSATIFNTYN